jgi:hypothetical protein
VTRSSSIVTVYLNGLIECTGFSNNIISSQGGLLIGRGPQSNDIFNGIIDEVGIWTRALSSIEILSLSNQLNTPCYKIDSTGNCSYTPGISAGC